MTAVVITLFRYCLQRNFWDCYVVGDVPSADYFSVLSLNLKMQK